MITKHPYLLYSVLLVRSSSEWWYFLNVWTRHSSGQKYCDTGYLEPAADRRQHCWGRRGSKTKSPNVQIIKQIQTEKSINLYGVRKHKATEEGWRMEGDAEGGHTFNEGGQRGVDIHRGRGGSETQVKQTVTVGSRRGGILDQYRLGKICKNWQIWGLWGSS